MSDFEGQDVGYMHKPTHGSCMGDQPRRNWQEQNGGPNSEKRLALNLHWRALLYTQR